MSSLYGYALAINAIVEKALEQPVKPMTPSVVQYLREAAEVLQRVQEWMDGDESGPRLKNYLGIVTEKEGA